MTIRKLVGTLENKEPYIDQATGHWFYWNGTKYVDSGYPYAVKPVIEFKIEDGKLYYSITWEAQWNTSDTLKPLKNMNPRLMSRKMLKKHTELKKRFALMV